MPVKSTAGLEQGHTFTGLDTKSGNLSPLSDPISPLSDCPPPPIHTQAFPAVTVSPINTELHRWGRETKTYRQSNMFRKTSLLLPMWFIISLSKMFLVKYKGFSGSPFVVFSLVCYYGGSLHVCSLSSSGEVILHKLYLWKSQTEHAVLLSMRIEIFGKDRPRV